MRLPLVAMLCTFTIFSIGHAFSNLFLNIYIWRHHLDLLSVGWFQFFSFLFIFIGFLSGALVIRLVGSRMNFIFSSFVALSLYMYLMWGEIDTLALLALCGMMNGFYIGLFYAGVNFYSLWFSEENQVAGVFSFQYAISALVQLSVPLAAGWIIHVKGYQAAFLTAILILLFQSVLSTLTPQVKIGPAYRRKEFFIPQNRSMGFVGLAAASFGFFYAFVHMSVSIFIYMFVKNEWVLGEWNMLFALGSIGIYYLVGRSFLQPYLDIIGSLGVILSTVITLTLFVPYPASFIVFNAIISVSLPMMWIPSFTKQFQTIRQQVALSSANPLTKMMQLLVFREFALCLGRILFLVILIVNLTVITYPPLALLIIFLCFMPTCLYLFSRKAKWES